MKKNQFILWGALVIALAVSGCASVDDFLEVSVDHSRPSVIFESDVLNSDHDTLVLMGTKNAHVYKGIKQLALLSYLINTNSGVSIKNQITGINSNILGFTEIPRKNLDIIQKRFPQLKDMSVFALYLEGITVEKNILNDYAVLGDGELRGVSHRNRLLIQEKKITFVIEDVAKGKSLFYKRLVKSPYQPGNE